MSEEKKEKDPGKKDQVKKDPDVVWMNCRASEKCEGKQAKVVFKTQFPLEQGGGTAFRYRCLTCKKAWHLRR